jgi:hypothetical protein
MPDQIMNMSARYIQPITLAEKQHVGDVGGVAK